MKRHRGLSRNAVALTTALVAGALVFLVSGITGCSNPQQEDGSTQVIEVKADSTYQAVSDQFGFATETVQGTYASTISRGQGGVTLEGTTFTLDDASAVGIVYYGTFDDDGAERILCVYLDDDGYQDMGLYASLSNGDSFSEPYLLARPHANARCYISLEDGLLTFVELADYQEGWYDGHYYLAHDWSGDVASSTYIKYVETVRVMDLTQGFVDILNISRTIEPPEPETLACVMDDGDTRTKYASGFSSYNDNISTLLTTEQEFCDQANDALMSSGIDWVTLTRTSWQNRWYRLEIDESSIPENMAKIDFVCETGEQTEDTVVSGAFSITLNAPAEEVTGLTPEGEDEPVTYGDGSADSSQGEFAPAPPSDLPASVDADELLQVAMMNLDGYWYSPELDRVYLLNDTGNRGKFYHEFIYCDLNGVGDVLSGSIRLGSTYSIILNANLDDEDDYEMFAVGVDKLVSDDLTLVRASSSMDAQLLGIWSNGDETLEFDNDASYDYGGDEWYWGRYFLLDEGHIAMGSQSDDVKLLTMSLSLDTLTIEGLGTFHKT